MAEAASLIDVFSRAASPAEIAVVVRVALQATPGVVKLDGNWRHRDLIVRRDKSGQLHITCRLVIEAGHSATVVAHRIRDMLDRGPFPIAEVVFQFTEMRLPKDGAARFSRIAAKE